MEEQDFKRKLNPEQYRIMRQGETETPHTGKYWDYFEKGTYRCAACESELFSSNDKFNSRTGWPTFHKPIDDKKLEFKPIAGTGNKAEIRCRKCRSHIGTVAAEGGQPYYLVNSVALDFEAQPGVGFEAVKARAEQVQDVKEKIEELRARNKEEQQKNTASSNPIFMTQIALAIAGVLVGAGALAALVVSGPASFICPAPGPAYSASGATTTPVTATSTATTTSTRTTPRASTTTVAPASSATQSTSNPVGATPASNDSSATSSAGNVPGTQ